MSGWAIAFFVLYVYVGVGIALALWRAKQQSELEWGGTVVLVVFVVFWPIIWPDVMRAASRP